MGYCRPIQNSHFGIADDEVNCIRDFPILIIDEDGIYNQIFAELKKSLWLLFKNLNFKFPIAAFV